MSEKKYAHLVFEEPIVEGEFAPKIGLKDLEGLGIRLACNCVSKPFLMIDKPHKHDVDHYLCSFGGNITNIGDFQGEAELSLGEEPVKSNINKITIVYIPAGLFHCPLNFTRIDKPVVFMDIFIGKDYTRV